jgi:hypothetical protein
VASSPSITGMRTSISTTSGRSSRQIRTASSPLVTSPTTAMPCWALSSAPNPWRTIAWSSASMILIIGEFPLGSPNPLGSWS